MKSKNLSAIVIIAHAVLGSTAVAQQDRFTLRVPNGLAFSDFRGVPYDGSDKGLHFHGVSPAVNCE
jgi:hypothetical protein